MLWADTRLPPAWQEHLFATLLAAAVGVFLLGNLMSPSWDALRSSAPVAVVCLGLLLTFYALAAVTSLAWGAILTIGGLASVTYFQWPTLLAMGVLGGLAFWGLVRALRCMRVPSMAPVAAAALVTAMVVLCTPGAMTSFDMVPRMHEGLLHQDTLFHAALAAMLRDFGVVSTGLHGVVTTPYHHLSHLLMAAISVLSGTSILEVYGVAPWVLFGPWLVFSVVSVALLMMKGEEGGARPALPWVITALALACMPRAFDAWGLWDSFLVSESYTVSLVLLLLGMPLLLQTDLQKSDVLAVFLLSGLIAAAKASVGLVYCSLWLARPLFTPGASRATMAAAALLACGGAGWVIVAPAKAAASQLSVGPLHFITRHSWQGINLSMVEWPIWASLRVDPFTWFMAAAAVVSFVLLHFIASWGVLAHFIRGAGWSALWRAPAAVYTWVATAGGMFVIALFQVGGGSAYYFSGVALFVALPVLLCSLVKAMPNSPWQSSWRSAGLLAVLIVGVAALVGLSRARDSVRPNPLIEQLRSLRKSTSPQAVLVAGPRELRANPVKICTARPLLYPAVSERAWTNVIAPSTHPGCRYVGYGYESYALTGNSQRVEIPPALPPGSELQRPPD